MLLGIGEPGVAVLQNMPDHARLSADLVKQAKHWVQEVGATSLLWLYMNSNLEGAEGIQYVIHNTTHLVDDAAITKRVGAGVAKVCTVLKREGDVWPLRGKYCGIGHHKDILQIFTAGGLVVGVSILQKHNVANHAKHLVRRGGFVDAHNEAVGDGIYLTRDLWDVQMGHGH